MTEKRVEKSTSLDVFYGFRKKVLLSFYIISSISLGILVLSAMGNILSVLKISQKFQLLLAMFLTVVGVIGGAYFSVILDLPKISYDLDKIKNEVASKKITDPSVFAYRIVTLLCSYFKFHFITIKYAFFKIKKADCIYSNNNLQNIINENDFRLMLNKSQETEEVTYIGAYNISGKNHHLYIIPIWFGNEWLGYIGILTENRLLKIFCSFLAYLENIYLDDLLIHVLNLDKTLEPLKSEEYS